MSVSVIVIEGLVQTAEHDWSMVSQATQAFGLRNVRDLDGHCLRGHRAALRSIVSEDGRSCGRSRRRRPPASNAPQLSRPLNRSVSRLPLTD